MNASIIMHRRYIYIIVFIISIILIVFFLKYNKKNPKSRFWENQYNPNEYKIRGNPDSKITENLHITLPTKCRKYNFNLQNNQEDLREFHSFIDKYYIRAYKYSIEYLKWYFSNTDSKYIIGIKDANNKLIGVITASPHKIKKSHQHHQPPRQPQQETTTEYIYISFLAVHSSWRKKGLASILISQIINEWSKDTTKYAGGGIFVSDQTPIPHNRIEKVFQYRYTTPKRIHISKQSNISQKIPQKSKILNLKKLSKTMSKTAFEDLCQKCIKYYNNHATRNYDCYTAIENIADFNHLFISPPEEIQSYIIVSNDDHHIEGIISTITGDNTALIVKSIRTCQIVLISDIYDYESIAHQFVKTGIIKDDISAIGYITDKEDKSSNPVTKSYFHLYNNRWNKIFRVFIFNL